MSPQKLVQLGVLSAHVDGLEVVVGSELVVGENVGYGLTVVGHPYVGFGLTVGPGLADGLLL